ncbi:MAG: ribose-phosphate pyrophosphokinae [Cyanobacteria bacterium RYN_339]|nr:ribose-phosphate pyrophosphokinae [Cyanobacteria bacterium RYN_339]
MLLAFATPAYESLRNAICQHGGFQAGAIERIEFPDGERYRRLTTEVADRDVVFVGGTISDADTLELYDLACAAAKYDAKTVTLVIPYFGYATMERAVKPGEVVTAKTRARLLSTIPAPARVVMLDLHSEGIPHYFEGAVKPVHLYGKPLIKQAVRELAEGPYVLACTDAGRAKWVESLANDLGVNAAFVFKRRLSGDTTQVSAVSAQVEGAHVIIYDDMIRTGGSLIEAAKAYKNAGATRISAITTHGLFPGSALDKLAGCGLLDQVIATDSHPRAALLARERQDGFLRVMSIAGLLAGYLKEHHA